jgi:hypothetical protein
MPRNLGGGVTVGPRRPAHQPVGGGRGNGGVGGGGGAVGNGGTAGVSGAGIFQPVVDAAMSVAGSFNTEAALNAVTELCRAFDIVGKRAADEIAWLPQSAEFFTELGQHLIRVGPMISEHGAQVRRAEEDKIRRVEEKAANERPWDIVANE